MSDRLRHTNRCRVHFPKRAVLLDRPPISIQPPTLRPVRPLLPILRRQRRVPLRPRQAIPLPSVNQTARTRVTHHGFFLRTRFFDQTAKNSDNCSLAAGSAGTTMIDIPCEPTVPRTSNPADAADALNRSIARPKRSRDLIPSTPAPMDRHDPSSARKKSTGSPWWTRRTIATGSVPVPPPAEGP